MLPAALTLVPSVAFAHFAGVEQGAVDGFLGLLGMLLPTMEIDITGSVLLLGLSVALEARPPPWVCMALVEALELFRGPAYGQRWSPARCVASEGDIAWISPCEQRVAEPSGQRQPQGASASADQPELDFSLIRGDLLFRVQRALGLIPRHGLGVTRRALVFAVITWLPIAIWAMLSGGTFPGMAREPLLQHFSVHVQCLVAIPLLIVGEVVAHIIVRRLVPQFVRSGLISAGDHRGASTR